MWNQVSNLPRTDFKLTKVIQAHKVLENEEEEVVPPHCQPNHRPFPPIEELQDKKYWAKLQTINAAINDPHTSQDQLNQIADLVLDTGNFSDSSGSLDFDICNLEKSPRFGACNHLASCDVQKELLPFALRLVPNN